MKKSQLLSLALASVLTGGMVAAHAATLDTTTATPTNDGILQNFTGIDWHENGAAWVQGFNLTGANNTGDSDTFTLTYQVFAGVINTTSPTTNLYVASPGTHTGTYELTSDHHPGNRDLPEQWLFLYRTHDDRRKLDYLLRHEPGRKPGRRRLPRWSSNNIRNLGLRAEQLYRPRPSGNSRGIWHGRRLPLWHRD